MTFSGAPIALPVSGLVNPAGLAIDGAGDIFLSEPSINAVVVVSKSLTGYGAPTTLPFTELNSPYGVAVDIEGDVFVADSANSRVVELPKTPAGYSPQVVVPFSGLSYPYGIAVDGVGNLFVTEPFLNAVVELPRTGTDHGQQTTLPTSGLNNPYSIAVDSTQNLFIADTANSRIVELIKNDGAYGTQVTLPFEGLSYPYGVAVSLGGNLFVTDTYNLRTVKLSKTPSGYGSQVVLPTGTMGYAEGVAADTRGNVFIADSSYGRVVKVQGRSVDFSSANVCPTGKTQPTPCSQTLALHFRMKANVTLDVPVLVNGATRDFLPGAFNSCAGPLKEGVACRFDVSFIPKASGLRQGSVEISDTGGAVLATVPLTGLGIGAPTAPPVARLSTTYLQFGSVPLYGSRTLPLTISNIGGGVLPILPLVNGRSFTVVGSTCGVGLAAGESCVLDIQFSGVKIAAHHSTLNLQTQGPALPTIFLEGVTIGLGVSNTKLEFGGVPLGQSKTLFLTITNYGLSSTMVFQNFQTGSESIYFAPEIPQNTCRIPIASGQSCVLPVQFSPTGRVGLGVHNDLLILTPFSYVGTPATKVSLHGSGLP